MSKSKRLRTLIKQAKMSKPYAMYRLGIHYQIGKELPADLSKAAEWICASAERGYAPAIEWVRDYGFDDDACVQANS